MSVIQKKEGGLTTENSEKEALYRAKKAKDAEKFLDSFLDVFGASGLTEERLASSKKSAVAQKIVDTGKSLGGIISNLEDSSLQKVQAAGDSFLGNQTASGQSINISPSILIGLSTAVIIVESLVILVFSVFRGVAQAIMRAGCALSDLLFVHFRSKFADSNDYQEIMIAILFFVGNVYANLRNLVVHFLSSIHQIIVGFVLVKFDKTVSSAVDNAINIVANIVEFYILLYFFRAKILIITIIILVIVSFFLKMDDIIKERGFKERAFGEEEKAFDFFDYVDSTTATNPLEFLKSD